jgi:hypothetical protein
MANRFWVGGTGTWDATNNGHWSLLSGSTGNQAAPVAGDAAIFDGASGGGTVTVNTTVSCASITCGAFTGTLDFSVNNNAVTLTANTGFNGSGSGARTIKLGNGLWDLTAAPAAGANITIWQMSTTTNLTFNAGSSNVRFSGNGAGTKVVQTGNLTYSTMTVPGQAAGGHVSVAGSPTIVTLAISGPNSIDFAGTITITNAFSWGSGASSAVGIFSSTIGAQRTISVASGACSISGAAIQDIAFTGGATFAATDSYDLGHNSGITITPPNTKPRTIYGA